MSTDLGAQQASSSTPTATFGESSQAQNSGPQFPQIQSRRADELARKDRTLVDFMLMLDDYDPLVR